MLSTTTSASAIATSTRPHGRRATRGASPSPLVRHPQRWQRWSPAIRRLHAGHLYLAMFASRTRAAPPGSEPRAPGRRLEPPPQVPVGEVLHRRQPGVLLAECLVFGAEDDVDGFLGEHPAGRSEERRVGKECRSRWSPYH